jgi:putative addiction module killer protein
MIEIRKTDLFVQWIDNLKDIRAKARILVRIDRMHSGHFGDSRPVGGGIKELRIFYGPGYRIYYTQYDADIVILLNGGNKNTQQRDIARAKKIAQEIEEQP